METHSYLRARHFYIDRASFSRTHLHFVHRGMVVTVLRNAHRPATSFFGNVGAQCVYMQRIPVQESEDHSDTQCKGGGRG